jgi:hypothetical protein
MIRQSKKKEEKKGRGEAKGGEGGLNGRHIG